MRAELEAMEPIIEQALGVPVWLEAATEGADPETLTPGERKAMEACQTAARRAEWLRGRSALKRLCRRLGANADTSRLRFPHPRISLSHCGPVAIAAAAGEEGLQGVGIDLEVSRSPRPEMARLFLTPEEQSALKRHRPERQMPELLRLWTIKESVFKADPGNQDRLLADYRLTEPLAAAGSARVEVGPPCIHYFSLPVSTGFLSVAIYPGRVCNVG